MPIRPSVLIGKQIAEMLDPAKAGDGYFYLKGDVNTDGSWRVMVVSGKIMSFQFRESGQWATKLAINPDDSKNYILKTEDINSYINMDELRTALAISDEGAMDGRSPVMDVIDGYVAWQYPGDNAWHNLIPMSQLVGSPGSDGIDGKDGDPGTPGNPGEPGRDGTDGKQIQLQVAAGNVQWKYDSDASWNNIISLSSLSGAPGKDGEDGSNGLDGKNISLQVSGGYIQWRRDGDASWSNLIATSSLKGDPGNPGTNGSNGVDGASVDLQVASGFIQWKRTNENTWRNVVSLASLQGSPGTPGTNGSNGTDGKSVELQKTSTTIQWRKVGETAWQNLISISELTGAPGTNGTNGNNGISYTPQTPVTKSINPGTTATPAPYQHADLTKPYKVIVNARSTQAVTVAGLVSDKLELRVGPTAASVALNGTGGFSIGVWESGITGIALMIGASVLDGGQLAGDVPAGWYFSVNRLTGTNATIVSCFTQSLTP